ncbi:MAG: YicC/YloC family endoribonuclease [Bacillota bacterium]|nr:YicC/YloC family endoribonuclease [Bacillota bacterium]
MVRSMTGFGRGEAVRDRYRVTVEARAVNHRFLDVAFRLPKAAAGFEERLRAMIAGRLSRGRVEVSVSLEEVGETRRPVKVDIPLARGYQEALAELQGALGLPGEITLGTVLGLPGVVVAEETTDPDTLWTALEEAAAAALSEIVRMRESEGARLKADLEQRLSAVSEEVEAIAERAPALSEEYRQRLEERVREVLGEAPVDEARLLQEVALVADRSSISEEVVRLRSHLAEAAATLASDEPAVGRKLEFLLQEMNREINTIGSKGTDVQIARQVIAVKAELEKIREQVQNIE